ncbi:2OG-Fe(II) oxygenase family protein [Phenylobacterium sp.]|uniref:isopenicillin N synthase family dioxygenase n=1 Tax=Phenylobacterium sp. TaxID=1871053 RepID=UPI0030F40F2D
MPVTATVPVIDLAAPPARVRDQLARACADWGFFHLTNHGVDPVLMAAVIAEARGLFAAPAADKRALSRSRDNPWGYYDRELTKNRRDKKEIFDIGPDVAGFPPTGDAFTGATPFPPWRTAFEPTARAYTAACEALCLRLLSVIASGLGVGSGALAPAFEGDHTSFLRLNHYPTSDPMGDEAAAPPGLGIHHHTDAGAITLLLTDGVPGLQVLKDDVWRPVDPVPGGLIVNLGDMVQVWSNDAYQAPLHQVLAMEDSERFSLAYFFNPAYSAVIRPLGAPARYRDLPWGEFRRRRADGDFADYGAEVQISDYRA